ncbi:uncharacterized protein [Palaemon carinicauda]|uniref:uncharacterized protein n=1 Tax=Palaemon carinicauda TaxID=392227 RepID=UPI0035B66072
MERGNIEHEEIKDTTRKEYTQRLKAIIKSKFNAGNMIKAINTWAVASIRYSAGIVEWMKAELRSIYQKTRKHMTIQKALHPGAYMERPYITRKEGGRGLLNIEDCVNIKNKAPGQYLKTSKDEWLRSTWKGLIKVDEDPEIYRARRMINRTEDWNNKPMHRHYIRQTKELASDGT